MTLFPRTERQVDCMNTIEQSFCAECGHTPPDHAVGCANGDLEKPVYPPVTGPVNAAWDVPCEDPPTTDPGGS